MLRIATVEDDDSCAEQIMGYLERYGKEQGLELSVTRFRDGADIISPYPGGYDVIFLDIEMPRVDGMSAAEQIRAADEDVVLVFLTNMAQYAVQGYSVGALDFLLKPVEYDTFALKLGRVMGRVRSREARQALLSTPEGTVKMDARKIYYVEVQDGILHYHTDQGVYKVRGTMQGAEKALAECHFIRCNYWYLVNLHHVSEVRNNMAVVAGEELEISRRNRKAFLHALTDYVGGNT